MQQNKEMKITVSGSSRVSTRKYDRLSIVIKSQAPVFNPEGNLKLANRSEQPLNGPVGSGSTEAGPQTPDKALLHSVNTMNSRLEPLWD